MESERVYRSVALDRELNQTQTPTDRPVMPHLDPRGTKRLQSFSRCDGVQKSQSTIPRADWPCDKLGSGLVSGCDGPVSLSNGPISPDPPPGVAELDQLLLRDSGVPEHRKLRHVLAWAQNFIRTGPTVPPAVGQGCVSPTSIDHVRNAKYSHVTLTNRGELPPRQLLQSTEMYFSPHSCPLSPPSSEPPSQSQPHLEPHTVPRPLSQPCLEPHPLPRPLSQPRPEPRPLSQPCPEPHPLPRPLARSRSEPRSQPLQLQPGSSVFETYLMCVARLSKEAQGQETQGHEVQLGCREEQECEEEQLGCREEQGRKEEQLGCREEQGRKVEQLGCSEVLGRKEEQLGCREEQGRKEEQLGCREEQGRKKEQLGCREEQGRKEEQLGCREEQGRKEEQLGCREEQGRKEEQLGCREEQGRKEEQLGCREEQGRKEEQLGCSEEQGRKVEQLGCREEQGRKEVQLGCREEQGRKEEQLGCREEQGRKVEQLGCREEQGRKEEQLGCREVLGHKMEQLGCREVLGHKMEQLGCREVLGHKMEQLGCREVLGHKDVLGKERAGRLQSQCVDSSDNGCMNLTGAIEVVNCTNSKRGEGSPSVCRYSTNSPVSTLDEMLPYAAAPVITPAGHSTVDLPTDSPRDHSTAELPTDSPADHSTTEIPTDSPGDHSTTELPTDSPGDHSTTEIPTDSPGDHSTTEIPTYSPADYGSTDQPKAPKGDTRSGGQDGCRRRSDAGERRTVEVKKAGTGPRRAVSAGSSRRRRLWEKSSMLWSSYPEWTLLPRMKSSNRSAATMPSVADCAPHDSALSPDPSPQKDSVHPLPQYRLLQPGGTVFDQWLSLPDELWMGILKLMSHGDLCRIAQTCQRLCRLANDGTLWQVVRIENSACLNADWLSSIGRRGPGSLTLYRCTDRHVTPRGLEELFAQSGDSLRELRILSCSGPSLHGDKLLLPCSRYCTRLTTVDVSWTGATDTGISALASTTSSLASLVINGCNITDRVFKIIVKRHGGSLRRLEIFGCRSLSAPCLSAMATACPALKVLNLGKLPKVTGACLTFVVGRLKRLTSLDLTGLAVVRDHTVHLISRQCPELQDLTLRCCPSITDRSLIEISTYSASIRSLDVSGCSAVTDLGIQVISLSCQRLENLDLSSTRTSNNGVRLLASYGSRHLRTIKLSFCYICQDSLRRLCRYHPGLRLLHLYGACDFHNVQELRLISPALEAKCDLTCVSPPGPPH